MLWPAFNLKSEHYVALMKMYSFQKLDLTPKSKPVSCININLESDVNFNLNYY